MEFGSSFASFGMLGLGMRLCWFLIVTYLGLRAVKKLRVVSALRFGMVVAGIYLIPIVGLRALSYWDTFSTLLDNNAGVIFLLIFIYELVIHPGIADLKALHGIVPGLLFGMNFTIGTLFYVMWGWILCRISIRRGRVTVV